MIIYSALFILKSGLVVLDIYKHHATLLKFAEENFIEGGNNRVILATDGDFNIGITNNADLVRFVEENGEVVRMITGDSYTNRVRD